jgi:DNA-binding beta-propeller fold protein YncE
MRSLVQRLLPALLCLLALALTAPPALAARGHVFTGATIGAPCELLEIPCGPGKLNEPSGIAVNEATGNVYVIDTKNNRVESFSSTGTFLHQFNGQEIDGLPGGPLKEAPAKFSFPTPAAETSGIAFDNSCHVQHLTGSACTDPSNEDVYVADVGHHLIDKFTATGEFVGQITAPTGEHQERLFEEPRGVAVDSHGQLWLSGGNEGIDNFSNAQPNQFISFRVPNVRNEPFDPGFPAPGFAVDSLDNLYLAYTNGVVEFSGVEGTLSETEGVFFAKQLKSPVDAEPPTGVATEVPGDHVYVDHEATLARYDAKDSLLERLAVPGEHGGGVAVSAAAETLYVADAPAGLVRVGSPELPKPPTVSASGVSDVSSTSATFSAEVNPRSVPGEQATSYRFEYGACSSTPTSCASSSYPRSVPEPEGLLAPSFEPGVVSAHPQDLTPHTVYHFRVIAHNAHAPAAEGEEVIFTTQGAGGEFQLPDGRRWELVSPPDKHGAKIEPINPEGIVEAAAVGGAFTFVADAPTESQPEGYSNGVQVLAGRGPSGWVSRDIALPHATATGKSVGLGNDYRFFSEDLSSGVVQPLGAFTPSISPEASEQTAFLHTDFSGPSTAELCASSCFHPLVTAKPGFANDTASPFVPFGEEGRCSALERGFCGPQFVGASPDASHIVLESNVGLTAGSSGGLYEWAAGKLTFIGEGVLGHKNESARGAVSADGSRVFFEGGSEGLEGLLVRDTAASRTARLDLAAPGCEPECESGGGTFQIASRDGSTVFFTDGHRLTSNSGATTTNPSASDLYVCELPNVQGPCVPQDLTPKVGGGERAGVVGGVLGASNDGSWVYFVADGVLGEPSGAVPGECNRPNASASALCNLYVLHREGGVWGKPRFITTLSQEDARDWSEQLTHQPARVSPNGQWLAFMSQRSLTHYDNRDALSGQRDQEVFLYDASRPVSVGVPGVADNPACASCNPTGARPHGRELGSNVTIFANDQTWSTTTWLAANIPGWTTYSIQGGPRYQPRYLSDSGRLFFNSNDALVPQDVNGTEDVYQYEPAGAVNGEGKPQCTPATATFSERSGGCVGLISSGSSSEESAFLDASENGSDVFFLTSAKLSPQDVDTSVDVYDAHECTSSSPCLSSSSASPPPCITEAACKASPSPQPQIFGAPASATFSGPGNLTPAPPATPAKPTAAQLRAKKLAAALSSCRKRYKHSKTRRASCEKQARKQYGPLKRKK